MARSGSRRVVGFPVEATSFVGRRHELAEAKRLPTAARLVTLTGPGGVGKTRLAARLAQQIARAFADGVWFVQLAAVQDDAIVPHAVADLCTPREQLAWARLAVFAGSFDLNAAEAVCEGRGLDRADVLDAVAGLLEKSILVREDVGGTVRYRLLAILRQYGLERLDASGELVEARSGTRRRPPRWPGGRPCNCA